MTVQKHTVDGLDGFDLADWPVAYDQVDWYIPALAAGISIAAREHKPPGRYPRLGISPAGRSAASQLKGQMITKMSLNSAAEFSLGGIERAGGRGKVDVLGGPGARHAREHARATLQQPISAVITFEDARQEPVEAQTRQLRTNVRATVLCSPDGHSLGGS